MDGQDKNLQTLVKDVEQELLVHIILNLRHRKLSANESQHLARDFLSTLPVKDKEDLLEKLRGLSEKYPEARATYIKFAGPHLEEERLKKLEEMTNHIKSGNIEKAIEAAKGGK